MKRKGGVVIYNHMLWAPQSQASESAYLGVHFYSYRPPGHLGTKLDMKEDRLFKS